MLPNYIQFIWSEKKKKHLHIFSSFYFEGHGYLKGCLHWYRMETVHIAINENYSLDKIPFSKPLTKRKKKRSCTCIACHPPKKVYSLKIIQTHTSLWISHYYPKLFF